MPAFNPETGEVIAPAGTASLAFFHADRPEWTANAYRTAECEGTRQGSHGSVIAALPDGSFPPVFLWLEGINYRVVAKAADGSTVATIERVTPDAEFVA